MRPPTAESVEPPGLLGGPAFAHARLPAPAGAPCLRLTGELDLVAADRARVANRRAQAQSAVLICDLGDLSFIDLTGLRALLDAAAHAQGTGRRLIVANSPPILRRMLGLLGLDDALEVAAAPLRTAPIYACTLRSHVS
jgi:anti-sigma B factor antagonist